MDIIETIRKHAASDPDKTAFQFSGEGITYGQLWEKSGRLAMHLIQMNELKEHQPIPVYGHKSALMPVCFLACTRSGHPYVPMDTSTPEERTSDILASLESPVVLAPVALPVDVRPESLIGAEDLEKISGDPALGQPDAKYRNRKDDIHYIIFTSGSTGKPKGVKITTGNLEAYLDWSVGLVDEKPGVFMNQAPFSFDLSVMDFYTGLATGSTIACTDRSMVQNLSATLEYLGGQRPDYWVSTPSFADLCLSEPSFSGKALPSMKKFLFCGEPLRKQTASRLMERFPGAEVINTYGPTETTVCVTDVTITEEMIAAPGDLPVGRAKPGTEVFADDPDGNPLPPGETGELIIAGDTVSPGYFRDPGRTAEVFFTLDDGTPAYRTGDLGRVDGSGMVWCKGRMDGQVKFHGYRIELGDIEKNLTQLQDVENAAVFLKKNQGSGESLAACVLQAPFVDTSYARRKWIRGALGQRLPQYMVPKRVIFFTDFPTTANGKLDRKALGEMI